MGFGAIPPGEERFPAADHVFLGNLGLGRHARTVDGTSRHVTI
jgi:hypothetical protein